MRERVTCSATWPVTSATNSVLESFGQCRIQARSVSGWSQDSIVKRTTRRHAGMELLRQVDADLPKGVGFALGSAKSFALDSAKSFALGSARASPSARPRASPRASPYLAPAATATTP